MIYQNVKIQIYDIERLLIDLIRNKNKIPFDYYKEIIDGYRKKIYDMDVEKLNNYSNCFPNPDAIMQAIQLEVF